MEKVLLRSSAMSLTTIARLIVLPAVTMATGAAQPPVKAAEPVAQPAVKAVIAAFDRYPIVALGMSHELQDELDLSLAIVSDPSFPNKANAIVLECGNPLYQQEMDHYVAGEDVSVERLQLFWRNTTQLGACEASRPKVLVDLVRRINSSLPSRHQIRILAGDPPIDWNRIDKPSDMQAFADRDGHFAAVVKREVLARHLRALLIVGSGHVLKRPITWASATTPPTPTVAMLIERAYPNSTFVIKPYDGFSDRTAELEPRLAGWPTPSLANLRHTWLGKLDAAVVFRGKLRRVGSDPNKPEDPFPGVALQEIADGFLYLGPAASLRQIDFTAGPDPAYAAELERRARLVSSFAGPLPVGQVPIAGPVPVPGPPAHG